MEPRQEKVAGQEPSWLTLPRILGILGCYFSIQWLHPSDDFSSQVFSMMGGSPPAAYSASSQMCLWAFHVLSGMVLVASIGMLLGRRWARPLAFTSSSIQLGVLLVLTLHTLFQGDPSSSTKMLIEKMALPSRLIFCLILAVFVSLPEFRKSLASSSNRGGEGAGPG